MPPKIRDLIWRAAYNALPCRRCLRHYTDTDKNCALCLEPEDSLHMILSCTKLRLFWRQINNLTLFVGVDSLVTADIVYGLAYYSVYLTNIFSRMHGIDYTLPNIYQRFRALSKHFSLRLPPISLKIGHLLSTLKGFLGHRTIIPPIELFIMNKNIKFL